MLLQEQPKTNVFSVLNGGRAGTRTPGLLRVKPAYKAQTVDGAVIISSQIHLVSGDLRQIQRIEHGIEPFLPEAA